MATKEEIMAYAKKKGIAIEPASRVNPRIAEIQAELNPPKTSTITKGSAGQSIVRGGIRGEEALKKTGSKDIATATANVIGGEALARGAGLAIAQPLVEKRAVQDTKTRQANINGIIDELAVAKREGRTQDIDRLSLALRETIQQDSGASKELTDLAESMPTTEEVIGSTVRLAGTLAGGAIASKAGALTGVKTAKGIVSGVVRGGGAGVIGGAVEGGVQGIGIGMEQNKDLEGVLGSGATGAAIGGVAGGILGGVAGGIQGKVNANKAARQQYIEDLVSPKETRKVREQAIAEGRVSEAGILKKSEILPSKKEANLASAVEDIVDPDKSVVENVDLLRAKGKEINAGVKDYITKNKSPFNTNQLRSQFDASKVENKLIFASDANAEKTYDAVVDEFMKYVNKKDTLGLFEARQSFDKVPAIRKLLDSEGLGENIRKTIVLDVRRSANEYIASLLPKGNKYRELLLKESRIIEVIGNIAEKESKNIGMNKLQVLAREYPWIKWLIGGAAAGAVGAAGVGVGGAIIGSTD